MLDIDEGELWVEEIFAHPKKYKFNFSSGSPREMFSVESF